MNIKVAIGKVEIREYLKIFLISTDEKE